MEETYTLFWKHPSFCLSSLLRQTVFPDNPASVCLLIRMPQSTSSRLRNQKWQEGNSSFQHSSSAGASCLCELIKDIVMWSGSGSKLKPNYCLAQCHSAGGQKSFRRARSWSKMIFWGRPLPLWCIPTFCFLLSKSSELTDVVFSELLINLFAVFLLFLGCVSADSIITTVGTDVTLNCNYDIEYYGTLPACWGRGAIPSRGCANEVIKSDGTSITSRLSERYLLQGDLEKGNVSLTIRRVEEADSGMYGCRVEIPGWFNDHKHQIILTVVAGEELLVCLSFYLFIYLLKKTAKSCLTVKLLKDRGTFIEGGI